MVGKKKRWRSFCFCLLFFHLRHFFFFTWKVCWSRSLLLFSSGYKEVRYLMPFFSWYKEIRYLMPFSSRYKKIRHIMSSSSRYKEVRYLMSFSWSLLINFFCSAVWDLPKSVYRCMKTKQQQQKSRTVFQSKFIPHNSHNLERGFQNKNALPTTITFTPAVWGLYCQLSKVKTHREMLAQKRTSCIQLENTRNANKHKPVEQRWNILSLRVTSQTFITEAVCC